MSDKNLAARCPFQRPKSASAKIYAVLARAAKPLEAQEIAKRAKVTEKQARTLLAAYMNTYHNAPLRRVGVQVTSVDGKFHLTAAKATPNAKRPPRGSEATKKAKKAAKPKPRKKSNLKPSSNAQRAMPSVTAETPVVPDVAAAGTAPEGEQSK